MNKIKYLLRYNNIMCFDDGDHREKTKTILQ